ncbi:unnamed protein product [Lasius platythorax]|uniref:Uncharacterized protein n=1 Tax=Lasius platythorax TaxID=488582 RepID=A0AAV2NAS7_9HYME
MLELKTNVMTNRLRLPVMRIHRCDIPDMFHGRPSPVLRTIGNARRAIRRVECTRTLFSLKPIASTTPLLAEPTADRTLGPALLTCAHLANVSC